ncbi:MAG: glycosyltransferase [Zetaproteobacteria bacterium]|nr:glycosyltransferase [Zetaproteobacteria bacterium]
MHILHIDTGKTWRGGQNQVRTLLHTLQDDPDIHNTLALPQQTQYRYPAIAPASVPVLPWANTGWRSLYSAYRLYTFCTQQNIDLIHAHSGGAHTLAALMSTLGCRIPIIVHRRVPVLPHSSPLSRHKYFRHQIKQYITVSHAIAQVLRSYGIPPDHIQTIYSSLTPRNTNPTAENKPDYKSKLAVKYQVPDSQKFFGTCAALVHDKGIDTALHAFAKLRNQVGQGQLFIAGDGPLKVELMRLAQTLGIRDCTHFMGHIRDTAGFFAALDILLFPSRVEGLGSTLLEAGYGRTLVLASNVGGIPEIIEHERTGFLLPPQDVDAWAAKINWAQHTDLGQTTQQQALFQLVQTKFSATHMTRRTVQLYQQVLQTTANAIPHPNT